MYIPDINVWLALAFEAHSHHPPAKHWFDSVQDELLGFCRLTELGFLRLATNPAVFGEEALNLSDAWDCFDRFLEDSRIAFTQEPLGLEHFFRRYTATSSYSPRIWNDAYLAAFAVTAGAWLVSFDRAFRQYEDLDCLILSGS